MKARTWKNHLSGLWIGLATLGVTGPAVAGDYELWREQVSTERATAIELPASEGAVSATDHRLWREQVPAGSTTRYAVSVGALSAVPEYALWREQLSSRDGAREELALVRRAAE